MIACERMELEVLQGREDLKGEKREQSVYNYFYVYFWNLAVPGSRDGDNTVGKSICQGQLEQRMGRKETPWFGRLESRQGLVTTPGH